LLQYIVENTLAGKSDLLKERTLGVEVFDRPPTYDTNADTVVRYTAGEVRKRLLLYYSERGRASRIHISLPAGSYIPEFALVHEEVAEYASSPDAHISDGHLYEEPAHENREAQEALASAIRTGALLSGKGPTAVTNPTLRPGSKRLSHAFWIAMALVIVAVAIAGLRWKYLALRPQTAVDEFWRPVLRDQKTVLICTGGSVFQDNKFSGVITAGKDIEYPFVSMQIASAIAQLSGLMERFGAAAQLLSSPTTPLNDLREQSVVLLGGYNNQWALRLLESQRFHFTPEPVESIVDQAHPGVQWQRDKSLPYSSADDYAVVARYRDATTDSWVVVLAGLGRNGTEAAAQFATSPRYMQLLKDSAGKDFENRNIEVVLRVRVIDGKTGAPSIVAVHMQ
jgi:hypothetical protein